METTNYFDENAKKIIDSMKMNIDGKLNLIVGVCQKIGLAEVFNKHVTKDLGRKPDIPYGIVAEMMVANIIDGYHPLYKINKYFIEKDIVGIFHHDMDISQITDDRCGNLLDATFEAGGRNILSEIALKAFDIYGIKINNINFDTTSKILWGEYESEDKKLGVINITFGHSKQKRHDKKQLKMAIGCSNGVIVDGKVLSGNEDDKTYNNENLEEVYELLKSHNVDMNEFHYIADSSAFTENNLRKTIDEEGNVKIKIITKMTNTTNLSKELIAKSIDNENRRKCTLNEGKKNESNYLLLDEIVDYKGIKLKTVTCYSQELIETKTKTINRAKEKEKVKVEKKFKKYLSKTNYFKTEEEAMPVFEELQDILKLKFIKISTKIETIKIPKNGRPSSTNKEDNMITKYILKYDLEELKDVNDKTIKKECTFILCSNNLNLTGEEILIEYKTQITVEKKFQQLKSPQFVNSIFLENPSRVESLMYLLLISMMVLSVVENVVRTGMKENEEEIIGPGKIKMKKPSLVAILGVFENVAVKRFETNGLTYRMLLHELNYSQKTILKYLKLNEDIFFKGYY
jgi:transposase